MEIRIASHPLCPHAQKLRLALATRDVDFRFEPVDLAAIPDWFRELSPEGRMPAIESGGDVGFDAAATIERYAPTPDDQRDLVNTASALLDELRGVFTAKSEADLEVATQGLFASLARVEATLDRDAPASELDAADLAFAPLFSLLLFYRCLAERPEWESLPRLRRWADRLLADDRVLASRCPRYSAEFDHFFALVGASFPDRHPS